VDSDIGTDAHRHHPGEIEGDPSEPAGGDWIEDYPGIGVSSPLAVGVGEAKAEHRKHRPLVGLIQKGFLHFYQALLFTAYAVHLHREEQDGVRLSAGLTDLQGITRRSLRLVEPSALDQPADPVPGCRPQQGRLADLAG
jgi:hypothetical protein